ncbi:MAG TPA: DNA recombination/repair protein RecA, partial [Ruminococcus sp.]|nr:DNA recombination/repair protein RecA [Ruminococcus sp.]
KIGVMYGNPETTTGGRALKFYASVRMEVRKGEAIKDGAEQIGSRTRVKIVKNKVAPPFKECEFDMMYGKGISRIGEVLDLATDLDIIHKSGSWFSYGDRKLGQGRDAVKAILESEPDFAKEVEEKILEQKDSILLVSKKNKKDAAVKNAKTKADEAIADTGAALDAVGDDLGDDSFEEFAPEE